MTERPPLFVVKVCKNCGNGWKAVRTSRKRLCPDCRFRRFVR